MAGVSPAERTLSSQPTRLPLQFAACCPLLLVSCHIDDSGFRLDALVSFLRDLERMKTIRSQILITLFIGCLAFSQITRAVIPPPDSGYPNFTTAERPARPPMPPIANSDRQSL